VNLADPGVIVKCGTNSGVLGSKVVPDGAVIGGGTMIGG
jgi:hypothetical protein